MPDAKNDTLSPFLRDLEYYEEANFRFLCFVSEKQRKMIVELTEEELHKEMDVIPDERKAPVWSLYKEYINKYNRLI